MVSVGQCRAEVVVRLAAGKASCWKVAAGVSQDGHDFFGLCKVHIMSSEMLCLCDGGGCRQVEQAPRSDYRAQMAKNVIVRHALCGTELSRLM